MIARRLARPLAMAASAVVVVAFALTLLTPMFAARLGAVDDHEIPVIGRQLATDGFAATVATRIDEHNGRFRPLYWLGRVTETLVWDQNLAGWYVDRALLLLVTIGAGYALARLWAPPIAALLAGILIIAGPQAEAFYRLGPQEAYAVPLALIGLALTGRRHFASGLTIVGLAAFTKEPFVMAPVIAAGWLWWMGERRWAACALAISSIAALGMGLAVLANGGDYYHVARTPTKLLSAARDLAVVLLTLTVWPLALTLARWKLVVAIGLGLLAWQATLLAGIGAYGRYLYPLVIAAALGSVVASARRPALLVVLAGLAFVNTVDARHGAQAYAANSRDFAAFVDALRADPRPLVISVRDPRHLEPAWAIRGYLPDRPMVLLSRSALPGFQAAVSPACLEIDVDGPPIGACPASRTP